MFCSFDNRVGDGFSLEPHSLIIPEHLRHSSGLSCTEKRKHFISLTLTGFFFLSPLQKQLGLLQRFDLLIGGGAVSLPQFILSVTGTYLLQVLQITWSWLTGSGLHTLLIQDFCPCCLSPSGQALIIKNGFSVICIFLSACPWLLPLVLQRSQGSLTHSSAKRLCTTVMTLWRSCRTQHMHNQGSTSRLSWIEWIWEKSLDRQTLSCRCLLWALLLLDGWGLNPLNCL